MCSCTTSISCWYCKPYHLTPLSDLFIQVKCKRTQFVKGQKQFCMVARVGARRECLIRWSDCWTEYSNAISLWKLLWALGFILNCPPSPFHSQKDQNTSIRASNKCIYGSVQFKYLKFVRIIFLPFLFKTSPWNPHN